ncbi:uncharacterized protein LOC119319607 [Triticum dicoccoides]|uniref:uncharacterized protein LOC119319607 n=1 Tax=Triticum dicoccoides TaxID=85692 RepID=UPI0018918992|nr:uncharacterized protein LOC119319607 [Triticum dicoccoides]
MDDVQRTEALLLAARFLTGGAANFAVALPKTALPAAAAQLAQRAREIADSADESEFDSSGLRAAADMLSQADAGSRPRAITDLLRECFLLEGLAAGRDAAASEGLRRGILDLAMAGGTLLRVLPTRRWDFLLAAEMAQDREEARERDGAREDEAAPATAKVVADAATAAGWWSRLASRFSKKKWLSGGEETDPEAQSLLARSQPDPSPSPSRSPSDSSPPWGNWLSVQMFALSGSMCLLPYMGPAALLGKDYSDNYRWWVHLVFQIVFCLVVVGVPCALSGRSRIEEQYARFAAHLGMLGITVNIIMFSHWMLAANALYIMWAFLVLASLCFLVYWIVDMVLYGRRGISN